MFFSSNLTVATTAKMVMANKPNIRRITQALITIRSMGTASYVGFGGLDAQDKRVTSVGEGITIEAPRGRKWIDVSSLFCSSDTADAVIEIVGEAYEGN